MAKISTVDCAGCGKPTSPFQSRVQDQNRWWHDECWFAVDWHIDEDNKRNPRPMTEDEKLKMLETMR